MLIYVAVPFVRLFVLFLLFCYAPLAGAALYCMYVCIVYDLYCHDNNSMLKLSELLAKTHDITLATRMAVAATMVGNLPEFHQENEFFSSYIERVELFFEANSIADEKVTVVLSLVGSKTYSLLRSLVAPAKPNEKSYKDLVAVLMKHFEPTPIVIAERFHFHRRAQAVGESISEYMAELRKLTTHCHMH